MHRIKDELTKGIKYVFSQPKIDYLILALLGLYIFPVWLQGDALRFGGDVWYPLNPSSNINFMLYSWSDNNGGMMQTHYITRYFLWSFFFIGSKLGLSLPVVQKLYLYLNFILPGLAMYYLTSVVYSKIYPNGSGKRLACWIAALFYMLCPVLFWVHQTFWPYGVVPFILAFFIKTVHAPELKGKIKYSLLASLFLFGLVWWLPAYDIDIVLLLILILYSVISREKIKQILKSWAIFASLAVLINVGITLPFLLLVGSQGGQILASVPLSFVEGRWLDEGPNALIGILTLTFHVRGFYFRPSAAIHIVNLFFPIAAFSALILKPRSKTVIFFALVSLVGIIISLGPNPPLGNAFKWLVSNILILRDFRSVGTIGIFIALGYAVLNGIAISELYRRMRQATYPRIRGPLLKIGKRALTDVMPGVITIAVVTLILINGWPLVTGAYYKTPDAWPNNAMVEIPSAYYDLDDWLSKQGNTQNYRLLLLPESDGYQQTHWNYLGASVMVLIHPGPTVHIAASRQGAISPLVRLMYDASEYDHNLMAKLAGLLNVKYYYLDGYDVNSDDLHGLRFVTESEGMPQIEDGVWAHRPTDIIQQVTVSTLRFDGMDDYVEVPNSGSLNIAGNQITLEAWIYPAAVDSGTIISKWYSSPNEGSYMLVIEGNRFVFYTITDNSMVGVYGSYPAIGDWYHVVGTYDGEEVRLYVNGMLEDTQGQSGDIRATGYNVYLGDKFPLRSQPFSGAISEARILNRALSESEVEASYNRMHAVPESRVVALWRFDESSRTVAIDDSPNDNNGEIHGAIRQTEALWPGGGWSVYGCSGSLESDGNILTMQTMANHETFLMTRPIDLDPHSPLYLIVRVRGDANKEFGVDLKGASLKTIYSTGLRACPSTFKTYIFRFTLIEPARYISIWGKQPPGQIGQVSFSYIMLARNADDIRDYTRLKATANYEGVFDELDVYRVDDRYFFPRVYGASKISLIDGSLDQMAEFIDSSDFSAGKPVMFLSDQLSSQEWQFVQGLDSDGRSPEITFEQLNPTKYVAHINSSQPCFIVLSTQFSNYWTGSINGNKIENHFMANGYANAWHMDKTGSFDVVLEYKVQNYYHIALMVSGLTIVGCLFYLGIDSMRKRKKQRWF